MFGSYSYFNHSQHIFVSGFLSGLVISPIVTPIEKLKIDFQVKPNIVIKDITYSHIFKGFRATCIRESISTGIYFTTYNFCKELECIPGNTNILFSGGIAGMFSWLFTYPIDVIKTRIQSGETNTMYQSYIKGSLFRGLPICLVRSCIVNSIGFLIYEKIN
jgi:solute carrier family 25 carnitine/acylcarnitine transporter 20/29